MKAVLVVDMPKSCIECPCHDTELLYCNVKKDHAEYFHERASWCPLKPMPKKEIAPERKIGGMTMNYLELAEARGRNKVINELLGETE